MAAILMVTHGTAGDVLPFVRIGRLLARRGHHVTLLTHAPYAATVTRAGLGFVPIDTESTYQERLVGTEALLTARRPEQLSGIYRRTGLFDQIRQEIDDLVRRYRPGETVLVGRHTSALSVRIAAELLGAPSAWVALAPTQLLVAPVAAAHLAHGLAADLAPLRAGLSLAPVADWAAWLAGADLTLGLWPSWFDAAGMRAPGGVVLTGFVSGDDFANVADGAVASTTAATGHPVGERAAGEAPVLVTGGTGRLLDERFYPMALDAVAALGRPALVVTPHRDLLPDRLGPAVDWRPWLPFPEVAPGVAALLHHGGIGTAVRALRSGTPQVILAHGADRPDNARRLAALGLAHWLPLEEWSAAAVATRLRAALAGPAYRPEATGGGYGHDGYLGDEDEGPANAAAALEALLARRSGGGAAAGDRSDRVARADAAGDVEAGDDVDAPGDGAGDVDLARRIARLDPAQRHRLAALLRSRRGTV